MYEQINHPVLITECLCNPVQSRGKMAELLFETYGVPSVGKVAARERLSICIRRFIFKSCIYIICFSQITKENPP